MASPYAVLCFSEFLFMIWEKYAKACWQGIYFTCQGRIGTGILLLTSSCCRDRGIATTPCSIKPLSRSTAPGENTGRLSPQKNICQNNTNFQRYSYVNSKTSNKIAQITSVSIVKQSIATVLTSCSILGTPSILPGGWGRRKGMAKFKTEEPGRRRIAPTI